MMKKLMIYFATFLIISSFYSCQSDDDIAPPITPETEEVEENSNLETIIEEIVTTNTDGWKITTARLSNTTVSDLDITNLYNVQDDRFKLSQASASSLTIKWLEAYQINTNAIDITTVKSDNYRRSSQVTVTSSSTESPYIFTSSAGDITITYNSDTSTLTGEIQYQNGSETMAMTLTSVTTSDFQNIETPSNFDLIFSATASQPLIGLNYSYATNSLYAIAHDSQELSIYKYDEENQTTSTISMTDNAIGSNQFEFIDGKLKWVSNFSSAEVSYDLTEVIIGDGINFTPDSQHRTTLENNTMIAVGGNGGYLSDQITTLSPSGTSFLELGNMPSERVLADVTIVDNDLYIFGGFYLDFMGNFSYYDSILRHDVTTGNLLETIPLGVDLIDSYVSRKGELIYIAGRVLLTNSSNGGIGETRRYFGVYNTITETLQELDIDSQLPTDRRIRGFAIAEDAMYFAFDEINTDTGFWRMDVYRSSL
ncbi:hypothetical protein ACFO3O_04695 [Dokdonia ponticola]|uniref:Uncharacterized protein n=1 Tax=Dokdonia ponticola TaxID=2041041 RepID=A0ABV9HSN4_9FLAO